MMDFMSQHAGIIGLIFFFLFFVGVLASLYWPGSKEKFNKYKFIPLEEPKE